MTTSLAHTSASVPLLKRVAAHERSLLAQIKEAQAQAHATLERARAEARALREADEQELAGETMLYRHEAETARIRAYEDSALGVLTQWMDAESARIRANKATVVLAHRETEQDGVDAGILVAEVAAEVLAMIVPGGSA